ncbi:MAG: S-layer homology domain-containing protein [Oscillospiraceae bacterium]|nr:S-layer homology domain-containing protein [Oscillospiraceae bacterium]
MKLKRTLSFILSICMLISLLPATVLFAGAEAPDDTENSVAAKEITYSFVVDGVRSTEQKVVEDYKGLWDAVYKEYPSNPVDEGANWAYLGTTVSSAVSEGLGFAYTESRFTRSGNAKMGEWLALRIYVPLGGVYTVSATGFQKKTFSAGADLYIAPLTGSLKARLTEGNTEIYGTVADGARTEQASFESLGIPESAKVGNVAFNKNLGAVADIITDVKMTLTAGDNVVLFKATATKAAGMTPTSVTITPVSVDELRLESIDVSAEKAYVLLDDADGMKVEVSGKMSGGLPADLSKAEITYKSSNEEIATVSNTGVIMPVSCGDFSVTATVTLGDVTLSKALNFAVSEVPIVPSFEIYFNDPVARTKTVSVTTAAGKVSNGYFSKDTHGENWTVNTTLSDPTLIAGDTSSARIQETVDYMYLVNGSGDFAVDFTTTADGFYDIKLSAMMRNTVGLAKFYVDGKYIGEFDGYADPGDLYTAVETLARSVELKKGTHTLLIKNGGKTGGSNSRRYIRSVSFIGKRELGGVDRAEIEASRTNLAAGESSNYKVKLVWENGAEFYTPLVSSDGTIEADFAVTSSDESVITVSSGSFKALKTGTAKLITSGTVDGKNVSGETLITVNENTFDRADLNLDEDVIYFTGGEKNLVANAILSDGSSVAERDITEVSFETSNESVATVENGVFKAVSEGTVTITAYITFCNKTVSVSKNVSVENVKIDSITAKTEDNVVQAVDGGSRILVTGIKNDGNTVDLTGSLLRYEPLSDGIVSVDADGYVRFISRGKVEVKVSADIEGKTFECMAEVVSGSGKTEPTIYTYEMRESALENIQKYDWAKSIQREAVAKADKWVDKYDAFYELMPGEGLPRTFALTTRNAPTANTATTVAMRYSCPYCGVDSRGDHGSYAWGVSPLSRPWKIQCPDCKRLFPSNDFESFYKLGVNKANGVFSREQAYEKHRQLFGDLTLESPGEHGSEQWKAYYGVGNEKGYLYNKLYDDKDSTWMVDDGFGWSPRDGVPGSSENPATNPKWAPIAYYMHSVQGFTDSVSIEESYRRVIANLRDAYLYTGDVKYARAGIIILDRFADVYPEYDLTKTSLTYHNSHGSSNAGKILGSIWEGDIADQMIKAYDAFYPMMDDPQVISYLSEKAEKYGIKNPKTSGELIRENIENGLIREVIDAIYTRKINGNFGKHQYTATIASVALDTYPETGEMLDWLCSSNATETAKVTDPIYPAVSYSTYISSSGGELLSKYVSDVDRDGFGNEVASGYNSIWCTETIAIAAVLARYGKASDINLIENPKYIKMFNSVIRETVGDGYTLQLGDGGSTAGKSLSDTSPEALQAFDLLDENDENRIQLAKNIYYTKKGNLDDIYIDIFSDNSGLEKEIEEIIEEHGELEFESENMTGFGLAVLRRGEEIKSTAATGADFRGDTWMYYGRTDSSHAHRDMLSLGIDAYGFNFMPDLGYPEATNYDENRWQWIKNTLAHNAVVVDSEYQNGAYNGTPLHYDSTGKVGLIDVEASNVYNVTDIYRRTAVSVAASDEVSYTIDFFRIKGGDKHTYSFHTQSHNGFSSEDLNFIPQLDEDGKDGMYDSNGIYRKYTYAGVGATYVDAKGVTQPVLYGPDPNGNNKNSSYVCRYPRGYTWLTNVNLADNVTDGNFSVNFKQTEFNKQVADSKGLNLKITTLNEWTPSEVAITTGYAPRTAANKNVTGLDYMFIHREGNNLDTLYTSVLQPYKGEEYIETAESIVLTADGSLVTDNSAKGVKITLRNGRTDYIIYSTADNVTYSVSDTVGENIPVSFNFRGFVGVYSVNEKGENIYSYVNDGDIIGNITGKAEYVGKVVSFTEELTDKNTITVQIDGDVDLENLKNRYIYVANDGVQNGSYRILSASVNAENSLHTDLYLGNTSLIRGYKDKADFDAGFEYNIAAEQSFTIPLSTVEDFAPEFDAVNENLTTSAGSSISVDVNAKSLNGESVTYIGTVLPRGASLNSETGVVTWKPDASQVGDSGFMITARDESGRESSVTFEVTVYGSTTGSKNETPESPSTGSGESSGAAGGGGGGGGAAPTDTPSVGDADSSLGEGASDEEKTDGENTAPDASGETDNIRFTDLTNHAWAADAINVLAADGIIKGTSASTFSPAANITRADFALLLVRAFKLSSDNTENFADVMVNDYYASELAIARNNGIVGGIGDNKFAPRNPITRQDMMVIVYRALQAFLREEGGADEVRDGRRMTDTTESSNVASGSLSLATLDSSLPEGASAEQYPDFDAIAPYAREAVTALISAGLVNGKNGNIAPLEYTTRAEVAVLLKRILDYIK